MARCPFATWDPAGTPGGSIIPRTVIVHSEATKLGLARPTGGVLEWHFMVRLDGRILQHVDTERRADANNKANAFAVSIETEDRGDPDREPWTDAQLWALERLIRWICTAHRIPLRRCPSWVEGGIGYHTMFGAPSPWTPVVKTCPGKVRIAQFDTDLLPRLIPSPEVEDLNADQNAALFEIRNATVAAWAAADSLVVKVDALAAKLDAVVVAAGLDTEAIEEAVKRALREGTG